jgi:hypothetical protein
MTDDPGSPEPERLFPECVFTETRLPGGELLLEAFRFKETGSWPMTAVARSS